MTMAILCVLCLHKEQHNAKILLLCYPSCIDIHTTNVQLKRDSITCATITYQCHIPLCTQQRKARCATHIHLCPNRRLYIKKHYC
ncbi:hypothetical protein FKM82_018982 [Ascaphus truei]